MRGIVLNLLCLFASTSLAIAIYTGDGSGSGSQYGSGSGISRHGHGYGYQRGRETEFRQLRQLGRRGRERGVSGGRGGGRGGEVGRRRDDRFQNPNNCGHVRVDVVFVLDTSNSISHEGFRDALGIVTHFVKFFEKVLYEPSVFRSHVSRHPLCQIL